MKKLIQSIMAIPIAERIGRVFGRKSLVSKGAEFMSATLIMRSFDALHALGAVAGGLTWLSDRKGSAGREEPESGPTGSEAAPRSKGKSRKAGKETAA